jgi:large subunit ribosomal protein L18
MININRDRKNRIRQKIRNKSDRPCLMVFRSSKHISGQIVEPKNGQVLAEASDFNLKSKSTTKKGSSSGLVKAERVGRLLARRAKKSKVTKVVFDRSSYPFHGRIKSLAEGARKGGLEF